MGGWIEFGRYAWRRSFWRLQRRSLEVVGGGTPDTTAPGEGGLQQAIEGYNEAIRLNPQYSVVYYNRGVAYYDLGRYERAIEDYGEAIRLNPQLAEPYAGRVLAYIYLGRDAEADRDVDPCSGTGF